MKKKPSKKTKEFFDYHECAEYIGHKLDIDLRNVAGKTFTGKKRDAPYQDFWYYLCDFHSIDNGCVITMMETGFPDEWDKKDLWAYNIAKAFNDEFGDEVEYWVEW